MVSRQPLPAILVQFNQETSITPGARCEGNADTNAIRTGTAGCVLGGTKHALSPDFAILGDSHARMWADGLDLLGQEQQQSILMLAHSSCTPIVGYIAPTRTQCAEIFDHVLNYVIQSPIRKIVLSGYWSNAMVDMRNTEKPPHRNFKTQLENTIRILQNSGKEVYIMDDIPELRSEESVWGHFIQSLRTAGAATAPMHSHHYASDQLEARSIILDLKKSHHIHVLDPSNVICPRATCKIVEDGRTLYRDKHHLTDAASQKFRNVFAALLDKNVTHQQ